MDSKEQPVVIACHDIGGGHWQVDTLLPGGGVHLHAFPLETLEWRAAEYNIPLTEVDQLIDIVLHERLLPEGPPSPEEAHDPDSARELVLARINKLKATKVEVRRPLSKGVDVLAELKAAHHRHASEERVAEKAAYASEAREMARRQTRSNARQLPPRESA